MDIHAKPVLTYRWITFLLAGGYCLYQVMSADYGHPGGPFRFLTIWALFLSFFAASRMLALSEHRITRHHHRTAMCAAVLNVMVVFLYWRLFFTDPALVNSGGHIPWHQQYYLHLLGPALQIVDALFIGRVFRKPLRAAPALIGLIFTYAVWAEIFVRTQNDSPVGTVTSGLPYPFLNSMPWGERVVFYGTNMAIALCVLVGLALLSGWVMRSSSYQEEVHN
ncbi:MAG: hypothetical protein ABJL99_02670 [Aliishimia sp.]